MSKELLCSLAAFWERCDRAPCTFIVGHKETAGMPSRRRLPLKEIVERCSFQLAGSHSSSCSIIP